MAKLILSLEGSVIREIPLDKERITIGRRPQNDIQIENLAVNGEHACIVTILNDSFLEDLGSTNGTLVNGHPTTKHILQNIRVLTIPEQVSVSNAGEAFAPDGSLKDAKQRAAAEALGARLVRTLSLLRG